MCTVALVNNLSLTDAPFVVINVDEICTTSIIISLNTYSHPSCGDVLQYQAMSYIQILLMALNTPLMDCRVIHCTTLQLHLHTIVDQEQYISQ